MEHKSNAKNLEKTNAPADIERTKCSCYQNAFKALPPHFRASSPFGGHREKYTRERHARGLARLAQKGELVRRLAFKCRFS